jgi:hypothetical protein
MISPFVTNFALITIRPFKYFAANVGIVANVANASNVGSRENNNTLIAARETSGKLLKYHCIALINLLL